MGMAQANLDLSVLQDMKFTEGVYTHGSDGYSVVATDMPRQHRGVVAVFYQASPWFSVKTLQKFVPNSVRFQMLMGERQWCIIGCYLAPNDALTIERVVAAVGQHPCGSELLVAGDFNAKIAGPEGAE